MITNNEACFLAPNHTHGMIVKTSICVLANYSALYFDFFVLHSNKFLSYISHTHEKTSHYLLNNNVYFNAWGLTNYPMDRDKITYKEFFHHMQCSNSVLVAMDKYKNSKNASKSKMLTDFQYLETKRQAFLCNEKWFSKFLQEWKCASINKLGM